MLQSRDRTSVFSLRHLSPRVTRVQSNCGNINSWRDQTGKKNVSTAYQTDSYKSSVIMYPNLAKPTVSIRSVIWYTSLETRPHLGLDTAHTIEAPKWTARVIKKTRKHGRYRGYGINEHVNSAHLTMMQYLITISSLACLYRNSSVTVRL